LVLSTQVQIAYEKTTTSLYTYYFMMY
jgi:hypothetical protein